MVAVSLYRGYLHNVPDVPRQWPVPTPKISLKSFKILLRRRARALSRLHQSSDANASAPSNSNPNPNPSNSNIHGRSRAVYAVNNNDQKKKKNDDNNNRDRNDKRCSKPKLTFKEEEMGKVKGVKLVDGGDFVRKSADKADAALMEKEKKKKKNEESVKHPEKTEVVVAANLEPEVLEKNNKEDATSDVEKRRKEIKEELEILKERKHSLVQVLKQILSAEEQLKRQNSTQGTSSRPPLPLQVDSATDSGSMTKVLTPRMGSDGNPGGDMDGGEAGDVSNHNMGSRQLPRMSSTSPSSDTQHRKPSSNMLPHSYRNTLGAASSPSRFAPPGQGQSVSVSGTSYVASSPSPAASGGTSVFRDARLPSPWN